MAELNLFHYFPKKTLLHALDVRIKLIAMIMFTITIMFAAKIFDFVLLTSVIAIALISAGLPVKQLVSEIKYFLFFLIIIIGFRSWSIPGTPVPCLPVHCFSREGLVSGVVFGWRLMLIIGICAIMTGTTTLSALRNALEWLLRPIPFIREARVAAMFSLTLVLIPLIFDQAAALSDAQKARGIAGRKSLLRRIGFLALPLLLQTFRRADELVSAMESRCYSEERTPAVFKTNLKDWLFLVFMGLSYTSILLARIF